MNNIDKKGYIDKILEAMDALEEAPHILISAKPIAFVGEKVTCANKHVICTVKQDLIPRNVVRRECFTNWCQPEYIDKPRGCTVCGAPWFKINMLTKTTVICIDGHWRPKGIAPLKELMHK